MKQLYFGIWKLILMLPFPLKVLVELLIVILLIGLIWPALKYVFVFVIRILLVLNKIVLGGTRYLLCHFARNSIRVHEWDEKTGEKGRRIDNLLRTKEQTCKNSKFRDIIKKGSVVIVLAVIYIVIVLPEFKLERIITDSYLENVYAVSRAFSDLESRLTEGVEDYPNLFKEQKMKQEEIEAVADEEETVLPLIYLSLDAETFYANIRKNPSLDSKSICTISKDDQLAYQEIYEFDGKRYWLKTVVETQNNVEGWISSKVIDQETLNILGLP